MTTDPGPPADEVVGPRVLLADDSAAERDALGMLLRHAGYEVDEADDGDAALLYLRTQTPDLLLLDLQMPHTDGFAVLAYLQKHDIDVKVILLTGLPLDEIQRSIHRIPGRSLPPLLLKPIDPDQLLNLVDMHLRGELPA